MSTIIKLPQAINLAYWLLKIHPEVFSALQKGAFNKTGGPLGALGQDDDDFVGVTPVETDTFDAGSAISAASDSITTIPDTGTLTSSDIASTISPDLIALPPPQLQTVSLDPDSLPTPDLVSAADVAAANTTVTPASASNVGSVAAILTTGLGALAAVTAAIYKAQSPQAATIATQAQRAAAGANPAPITYGYNAAGQLVPILQTPTTAGIGLSPATLASLGIPASWAPYVVPVVIGVIILAVAGGSKK